MTLPYNGFTKMHDKFLKSEAVLQTKAPSDEGAGAEGDWGREKL